MSESEDAGAGGTPPRHGRRARRLSPEESAALEARTAENAVVDGEPAAAPPPVRGAVAPPSADAPVPALRKFGKRARIIELTDAPEDEPRTPDDGSDLAAPGEAGSSPEDAASPASPADAPSPDPGADPDGEAPTSGTPSPAPSAAGAADGRTASGGTATATIERDVDGVELGEMSVSEAPAPRPAPRYDGKVLHRPERSGSRPLLWVVWALIAIVLVALVALLLTGVLGPGTDGALGALAALPGGSVLPHPDPSLIHPVPEVPAA